LAVPMILLNDPLVRSVMKLEHWLNLATQRSLTRSTAGSENQC
jgi:hypothetical protein